MNEQEKPADAWGQPISAERQAELQAILDAWAAETDHGGRSGPFNREGTRLELTGADVSWMAKQAEKQALGEAEQLAGRSYVKLGREAFQEERGDVQVGPDNIGTVAYLNLQGANLFGAHLEGARIYEAHLEGASLHGAHLEGVIFRGAHLEGADLSTAFLEGAAFAGVSLAGADLRYAQVDSKTTLLDVIIDDKTRLADIRWGGVGTVDLMLIDWDRVRTLGDEQGVSFRSQVVAHETAVRAYRQIAAQLRAQGLTEVADRFLHRAQIRQRKLLFRRGRIPQWLGSWFLAVLAGYGFRPGLTILWYLVVVSGFAAAYFLFGPNSAVHLTWNEALVVSLTAFHGRGFFATTFQPGDPLAALAAGEAVIGLLIEISFIATFTQRFFNAR